MLPAEHISMLDVNGSLSESLVMAHLDMHTRFPVAERVGDPQSILGYVNFKDLVALMRLSRPHEASLRAILRPLPSLEADLMLTACLERLIREHTHIALVRDAGGKVVGLITLEDILEELVGDIQDEYDRLARSRRAVGLGVGGRRRNGAGAAEGTHRHRPGRRSARQTPEGGVRNVSDWIIGHLRGRVPRRRHPSPSRRPRGGAQGPPAKGLRGPDRTDRTRHDARP